MNPCDSQQIKINMKYNSNTTVLAIPDRKCSFLSWVSTSDWFTRVFHGQKTVDMWCKYVTDERITNSSPIATGSSQASRQVVPPPLEVFWRKVLRAILSYEAPRRYVQSCEAQQGMYNHVRPSKVCRIWPKAPRGSFDQKCCMRSYHGRSHRQLYIVNWKSLGLKL